MISLFDQAIAYVRSGHRPFPVRADKRPIGRWGQLFEHAPTEEDVLRAFSAPHAGIALVTGIDFDVLDIEYHGLAWAARYKMPVTPTAISQRRGRHYYFQTGALRTTAIIDAAGRQVADVRAARSCITAPPSVGMLGVYRWLPGRALGEVPLADPPSWLIDLMDRPHASHSGGGTGGGQTPPHATTTVSPPDSRYASRSERDLAWAIEQLASGVTADDVFEELLSRPAAIDRAEFGFDYARRTIAKAEQYINEHVVNVMIDGVVTGATATTLLLDEVAGRDRHRLVLDYPETPRSSQRWAAIRDALGVDEIDPQQLQGRRLAIELISRDGSIRVGRVFPARP